MGEICRGRTYLSVVLLALTVACSGRERIAEESSVSRHLLATSANSAILGFEDAEAWFVSQGSMQPPRSSPTASEGASSVALNPAGYAVVKSASFPVLSAVTGQISYDLWLPPAPVNPYWLGATQLYLDCPSRNIFNAYSGQVELTGLSLGQFNTLPFSLSESTRAALEEGCEDLSISIALNVPWDDTGTYLLDKLQIATAGDLVSPVLDCVFTHDSSVYYARFSYLNTSTSTVTVPIGPENLFFSELAPAGQPQVFLSGSSPETFTVAFDGRPITWQLGRTSATAAADSPPCPPTWVPSWTGRGPLSTTITTNRTFLDPVPTLTGRTLRTMAHLTTGGSQVRVRFSQRFSPDPLGIDAAHVAVRSTGSGIVASTDQALTFGGNPTVNVPAGEDVWSDPVDLTVQAGQDLAVSIYVPGPFVPTTQGGRGMIKTSYYKSGNQVSAASLSPATTTRQVFAAYEVQVLSPGPAAAIVALGDSITEGACSSPDANGDWPDLLSARLPFLSDGTAVGVLNAGIGSGRFASSDGAGLRGLTRLDELLTLPAVRWVTVLMGVNDISYELVDASFLEDAYSEAIAKVHAVGKRIIGIPILPFGNSTKDVGSNKEVAQAANAWIRAHDKRLGAIEPSFDAVVDLESVLSDVTDPAWALRPDLTCDKVHPNQAGYRALANAIPLDVFE